MATGSRRAQRRRERELSSVDRETYARRVALQKQYAYARANWRVLATAAVAALVFTPLAYFLPVWGSGFLVGVYVTLVAAMLVHWVIVASGSAQLLMGHQAEVWTRDALKEFTKSPAWKIVHNARLSSGDIDTVIIGPPGVVVVETKWSGGDWNDDFHAQVITAASEITATRARSLRLFLQPVLRLGVEHVHPVVVLWPDDPRFESRQVSGVTVMRGGALKAWTRELPGGVASPDEAQAAWARLEETHSVRERHELEHAGRRPRTPTEFVTQLVKYPIGAILGALAVAYAGELIRRWILPLPSAVLPMAGLVFWLRWFRRYPQLQALADGASIAGGALVGYIVVLYVVHFVRTFLF